eukprot:472877-Pleurochrysis_carterae.AAC.2
MGRLCVLHSATAERSGGSSDCGQRTMHVHRSRIRLYVSSTAPGPSSRPPASSLALYRLPFTRWNSAMCFCGARVPSLPFCPFHVFSSSTPCSLLRRPVKPDSLQPAPRAPPVFSPPLLSLTP